MEEIKHVAVVDFGSQYTQLIVRRVRELGFFATLYALEDFEAMGEPGAIILSGGPKSTSEADAPDINFERLQAYDVPILGAILTDVESHFLAEKWLKAEEQRTARPGPPGEGPVSARPRPVPVPRRTAAGASRGLGGDDG